MKLHVHYHFLPKKRSVNASLVMDHFGIDFEQGRHVIADSLELPIQPGDVVLFTGPSGSGKSSLMRAAAEAIVESQESRVEIQKSGESRVQSRGQPRVQSSLSSQLPTLNPSGSPLSALDSRLLWIDRLELPDCILADALPLPVQEALGLLSMCGLSEAQLLLRTPAELSDGQRYRFRLAYALAHFARREHTAGKPTGCNPCAYAGRWLVADEFTATLDRTLAKVIAYNLRRLASRTGTGFLLATTHEDVIEDLDPDVLVRCDLDGTIALEERRGHLASGKHTGGLPRDHTTAPGESLGAKYRVKKNESASPPKSGSAKAPRPIGRISLGGITAATTLGRRGE